MTLAKMLGKTFIRVLLNFYQVILSEDTGHIYTIYCWFGSNYNEHSVEMDQCMKWMQHLFSNVSSDSSLRVRRIVPSITAEVLLAIQWSCFYKNSYQIECQQSVYLSQAILNKVIL